MDWIQGKKTLIQYMNQNNFDIYCLQETHKISLQNFNYIEYNGIRSINFLSLNKPLPTTMYVQGNRIRLKHTGQDRTPICAICKNKGHYRSECPQIQNQKRRRKKSIPNHHGLPMKTDYEVKQ